MQLWTINEFAEKTGADEEKIRKLIKEGMPHLKIGREVRLMDGASWEWYAAYKPLQERLEEAFVDEKGRTLDHYQTAEETIAALKITKEKLYRLCRTGMPHAVVGKKRFFQLDDLVDYFYRGEKLAAKKETEKLSNDQTVKSLESKGKTKEDEVVFVVDGSTIDGKCSGAGVVKIAGNKVSAYSFGEPLDRHVSSLSEAAAINRALSMIREEGIERAIIYTDQEDLIPKLAEHQMDKLSGTFDKQNSKTVAEMDRLLKELKGRVLFRYYGRRYKTMYPDERIPVLYQQAHLLSRYYRNEVMQGEELERLRKDVEASWKPKSEDDPLSPQQKETIQIRYVGEEKGKGNAYWYEIKTKNNDRQVMYYSSDPTSGILSLAYTIVQDKPNKPEVVIEKIPTFEKDREKIIDRNKERKLGNLLIALESWSDFHMKDDYRRITGGYDFKNKEKGRTA